MDFFFSCKEDTWKRRAELGNLGLWKKATISTVHASLYPLCCTAPGKRKADFSKSHAHTSLKPPLALPQPPPQPQQWFELGTMHNQCSSSAQGSLESSLFHPWPVPGLCRNCFSRVLQSCWYTRGHCHVHRDLLRLMPSSLLSSWKLSGKPPKKNKSMGDRHERQTLYSWYPPAQWWLTLGFDGGFEKGCKIWVWICLSPFSHSLKPAESPLPDVTEGFDLGHSQPAWGLREWVPQAELGTFWSQIPPRLQIHVSEPAHLFSQGAGTSLSQPEVKVLS